MKTKLLLLLVLCVSSWARAQTNITAQGSDCTTTNACAAINLPASAGAVGVTIDGTFTATLQFEVSADRGKTWVSAQGTPLDGTTGVTSVNAAGVWRFAVSGLTGIRVRCSAYVSGTVIVNLQQSPTAASLGGGGSSNPAFSSITAGNNNSGAAMVVTSPSSLTGNITAQVGAFTGATQYFFPVFGASGSIGNSLCSTNAGLTVLTCTYTGGLSIGGSGSGTVTLSGSTSGSAAIQVAAVAGSPNPLQLPTATAGANQFLKSDGGNPQQLSWAASSATPCTTTALSIQYNNGGAFGCVTDFTFSGHTITSAAAGLLDLSAMSGANAFKVPVGAGLTSGADGVVAYDSTGKLTHVRTNGADSSVVAATATSTTTTQTLHATGVAGIGAFSATAISDISNLYLVDAQTAGSPYTVPSTDCGKLLTINSASAYAVTLPQATGSFVAPCVIGVQNLGAGVVTITPTTSTVGGLTSIGLVQNQGVTLWSDSTNYQLKDFSPAYLPVALQVNTLQVGGTATGTDPTLTAIGSDTNLGIKLATKGTGQITLQEGTDGSVLVIKNAASTVVDTVTSSTGAIRLGAAGTPGAILDVASKYFINSGGINTKYNNISTVSNGQPSELATVDLTAQSAAITATTLYAVPAAANGMYRVCFVAKVTTAATTSSTLGGAAGFQLTYTDQDDSVVVTTLSGAFWDSNATNIALNTTQAHMGGCTVVNAKASTNIQYIMGYTSSGGTAMQYNLHIKAEAL